MLQITTVLQIRLSSKVIGPKVELCKIKISIFDFWTLLTLHVNSEKVTYGGSLPQGLLFLVNWRFWNLKTCLFGKSLYFLNSGNFSKMTHTQTVQKMQAVPCRSGRTPALWIVPPIWYTEDNFWTYTDRTEDAGSAMQEWENTCVMDCAAHLTYYWRQFLNNPGPRSILKNKVSRKQAQ